MNAVATCKWDGESDPGLAETNDFSCEFIIMFLDDADSSATYEMGQVFKRILLDTLTLLWTIYRPFVSFSL